MNAAAIVMRAARHDAGERELAGVAARPRSRPPVFGIHVVATPPAARARLIGEAAARRGGRRSCRRARQVGR